MWCKMGSGLLVAWLACATHAAGDSVGQPQRLNELGYRLLVALARDAAGERNVVLGPTSVTGLLAMALLGSVGDTYDELATALGFSQDIVTNRHNHEQLGALLHALGGGGGGGSGGGTLHAQGVFVSERAHLRPLYTEFLRRVYDGAALPARFDEPAAAQALINQWVREKTVGKVDQFLQTPLPRSTRVALLSAQHFSGQWAQPFEPEFTRNMTFHKSGGGEVLAEMMLNYGQFNYTFSQEHGCHMVSLPYKDGRSTLYLLKPHGPKHNLSSLDALLHRLDWQTLDQLTRRLRTENTVIRLPRMSLRSAIDLKAGLRAVGVGSMFEGRRANFALMVEGGGGGAPATGFITSRIGEGAAADTNTTEEIIMKELGGGADTNTTDAMVTKKLGEGADINTTDTIITKKLGGGADINTTHENIITEKVDGGVETNTTGDIVTKKLNGVVNANTTDELITIRLGGGGSDSNTTDDIVREALGSAETNTSDVLITVRLGGGGGGGAAGLRDQLARLPNPGVHVDAVMHEVRIDIDERGTEAAAASGGFLARTSNQFLADSPFLVFIRDELTGLVTYSAVINDPTL